MFAVLVGAICLAAAAGLAQVDADLGAPAGPDRLLRAIDAGQVPTGDLATRARDILRTRPIDGTAYRVLAGVADSRSDPLLAASLYAVAVGRAPRDRLTRIALADRAFAAGDAAGGFKQLDALLRVAPLLAEPVLRGLMPRLAAPRMQAALVSRLRGAPAWRSALVPAMLGTKSDPGIALALLSLLSRSTPLTDAEADARVRLLQRTGRYADARRAWLAALPAARSAGAALLFDGGFEQTDRSGVYAWQQSPPPGVDIGPDRAAAEGQRSLAIVFSGREVATPGLQQALALASGAYTLDFVSDNRTDAQRPFAWRVTCSDGRRLADALLPVRPGWRRTRVAFQVPAGCSGQTLRLEFLGRSMAERQISGALRLDALQLSR